MEWTHACALVPLRSDLQRAPTQTYYLVSAYAIPTMPPMSARTRKPIMHLNLTSLLFIRRSSADALPVVPLTSRTWGGRRGTRAAWM